MGYVLNNADVSVRKPCVSFDSSQSKTLDSYLSLPLLLHRLVQELVNSKSISLKRQEDKTIVRKASQSEAVGATLWYY